MLTVQTHRPCRIRKEGKLVEREPRKKYYVCNICGLHLANNRTLTRHQRRHFPHNKNVKCKDPDCPRTFFREQERDRHYVAIHQDTKEFCEFCSRMVRSLEKHKHTCRKYLESQNLHKCRGCWTVCDSAESLEKHMITCYQVLSYQCHVCGGKFTTEPSLKHHMNIHNKPQKAQCEICGQSVLEYRLQKHMAKHQPEKPCQVCGEMAPNGVHKPTECPVKIQFRRQHCPYCHVKIVGGKGLIKRHVGRKHPDKLNEFISKEYDTKTQTNYECDKCGRLFTRYTSFQKHVETCVNENPYQCATCHQRFESLAKARAHMKHCAGDQEYYDDDDEEEEEEEDEDATSSAHLVAAGLAQGLYYGTVDRSQLFK